MALTQPERLNYRQIENRVKNCPRLPSLSTVNSALLELLHDDQGYTSQLAEVVRRDPSLTARMLRLVNSVYYGLTTPVNTVEEAVLYLGVVQIHQLAMITQIIEDFKKASGNVTFEWRGFWQHSIATAILTREIVGSPQSVTEEVNYVAGLIHDVGKITMAASFPQHFEEIYLHAHEEKDLAAVELEVLGMDHSDLGGLYLTKHKLPDVMVEAAQHHHQPERALHHPRVAAAVQIADLLVRHANIGCSGDPNEVTEEEWLDAPGWKILFSREKQAEKAITCAHLQRNLERLPSMLEELI